AHDTGVRYPDCNAAAQALGLAWQQAITSGGVPLSLFALPDAPLVEPEPEVTVEPRPRTATERDARPPQMTEIVEPPPPPAAEPLFPRALVREESSQPRDDVATMIRTSDSGQASSPRRRRAQRRQRLRLALGMLIV